MPETTFNEDELKKIQKAISGIFRRSSRKAVSKALYVARLHVEAVRELSKDKRRNALVDLLNEATAERQRALSAGARSYGDSRWAPAAAVESWFASLILWEDQELDDASIARIDRIIDELSA